MISTNILYSSILSAILTCYEIPCYVSGYKYVYLSILMFLHHFGKLFIFFTPFTIDNIWILGIVTAIWGFVCIQNIIRIDNPQSCILSNYINRQCNQNADEQLRDIFYYLGLKENMKVYKIIFLTYSILLLSAIVFKIAILYFKALK